MGRAVCLVVALASLVSVAGAAEAPYYVRRATWQETMLASQEALADWLKQEEAKQPKVKQYASDVMRGGDAPQEFKADVAGWKDLYLIVTDDGDYHHDVANWAEARLVGKDGKALYLDTVEPVLAKQGWGSFKRDNKSTVGGPMQIADRKFARGLGTHANSVIHYVLKQDFERFEAWIGVDVSRGKNGSVRFFVSNVADRNVAAEEAGARLWEILRRDFADSSAGRQMGWEREDRIWEKGGIGIGELAQKYALAARGGLRAQAAELAKGARDAVSLQALREVYYRSRAVDEARTQLAGLDAQALRLAVEDLTKTFPGKYVKGASYLRRLAEVEQSASALAAQRDQDMDADRLIRTCEQFNALSREALLANPLLDFDKLIVVKRKANLLGLPQNWQSNSSLPKAGFENEIAVLTPPRSWPRSWPGTGTVSPEGKLATIHKPDGGKFVGDVDLHFDAGRMLFSSLDENNRWQVFEIGVDGQGLRQVTGDQPDVDYYDACYLPDDKILFTSTACFVGVPCVYGSSHVTNMYRMDADGKNIRQLTVDQEHNWCPTMLNNGRVLYARWEYADTPHAMSRLLFHMNPDGTNQMEYYGSNSVWPNGIFYARPVPGHPTKVVGIVSGHHGVPRMGELVIFDPGKSRYEAEGVVQRIPGRGKKVEPIFKDALVNDSWPKFLHPFPLSEKYFLVAAQPNAKAQWGLYLADVFDNLLLIMEAPGYVLFEPVPLRRTPRPPVIRDKTDPARKDALVYLTDIYQGNGLKGVPRGTVKQLRIFSYHYAYQGMGGLLGVVGMDGPWDVRRVLGTVPVEEDGSAVFRVPAYMPIAVQPLDAEGKALQLMRSWMTAMPGENLSCVGCHERQNTAPPNTVPAAFRRPPSEIKPWLGPLRGFSYPREVQPVIDKYCVGCHNGQARPDGVAIPDLRGAEKIKDFRMVTPGNGGGNGGKFSVGYANLHRYVRRSGIESDYHLLTPTEFHADTTDLVQMLAKGHHNVKLDAEAWDRLITWIDMNCPYHGTWGEEIKDPKEQRARRRELLKLYAGLDDDPEEVPPASRAPVAAVMPEPERAAAVAVECPKWPFDAAEAARRQSALSRKTSAEIDLGGGLKLEMVLIPPGEFVMGDAGSTPDERPRSRVKIEKPFWMGRCEISNRQYARFDPTHDSHIEDKLAYQFGVHGFPVNEPDQPVVRVPWKSAMAFCAWLSERSGRKFSLPTEAQWEYACRAGAATPFYFGGLDADFSTYANLADAKLSEFASDPYKIFGPLKNASQYDDYIPKDTRFNDAGLVSASVGGYQPNAWGLHDMHGNVWEWTRTSYRPYPYVETDGRNDLSDADRKVARGGSWRDVPKRATAAYRLAYRSWQPVYNVGFRVVCEAE